LVDQNYRYRLVNQTYLDRRGQTWEEVVGSSVSDFIGEEIFQTVIKPRLDRCLAGETLRYENWFHFKQVGDLFLSVTYSPYVEVNGTISGVVVSTKNATDRKRSEIALVESQRFLQTVIDTFPLVVFWKDRQSVYLGCNQRSALACGLKAPADIIGKTDYDMPWGATEADSYRADDRRVMDSGQAQLGIIESQVRADGSTIWIETNKLPLYNLNNQVIGVLGTYQDITERKQLEQEQARLLAILEASSDLIGTRNPDGRVTWLNHRFRQLFNLEAGTNLAGYYAASFHPQWAVKLLQQEGIPHAIQHGSWLGETALLTPDGQEIPVSQMVMAHKAPDGSLEYFSTIIRDITERKATEAQLEDQARMVALVNQRLSEYSQTLELKVEARTQELSQTLANLSSAQAELVHAEKMAALGQLTASVAHEINTPLGVIRGATSNIVAAFNNSLQQLPKLLQDLSPSQQQDFWALVNRALQNPSTLSTQEERRLQRKLQAELLAEGNPQAEQFATQFILLGLGADLQPYRSILQDPKGLDLLQVAHSLVLQQQSTSHIQQEVDRAAKIVFALKTYSRRNEPTAKYYIQITDGIEIALTLYQNRLKQGITVMRDYGDVPKILCDPDELIQVWVNLVDNAVYAMGQQGILEITVRQEGSQVVVSIQDSGCGIPAPMQTQIFEPFFTTKPRGEGSGLGLDIIRKILHKQGGTIRLESQPGRTIFTVVLPLSVETSDA